MLSDLGDGNAGGERVVRVASRMLRRDICIWLSHDEEVEMNFLTPKRSSRL